MGSKRCSERCTRLRAKVFPRSSRRRPRLTRTSGTEVQGDGVGAGAAEGHVQDQDDAAVRERGCVSAQGARARGGDQPVLLRKLVVCAGARRERGELVEREFCCVFDEG